MNHVLNEHTKTLHRSSDALAPNRTSCGALRNVPDRHVRVVGEDVQPTDAVDRCGRCFEGEGGY
ncbi:hypothetical protein [Halovivax sp.]|uniref:hypothetical protein n=1 Tax=Halovivax sp. TaxID=1935978 RepID=UPI0025C3C565|nr:hypothetical protein [Halovivax sp.]